MKPIAQMINNKKLQYGLMVAVAVVLSIAGFIKLSHPSAEAQTSSGPGPDVPQFGINIGDYSNCMNGYHVDDVLGDQALGDWTPVGGGQEDGFAAAGGYSGGGALGAGDCIQAGMYTNASNTYDEDFRVGIRVAPYSSNNWERTDGAGSTVGADCDWADSNGWHYTPWASAGGGTSAPSVLNAYTSNGSKETWGVECTQLDVQTSTLPAGMTSIVHPYFAVTISHFGNPDGSDGAQAGSWAYGSCYLDSSSAWWDPSFPNIPTPSCLMNNIGSGGNFWSASVTMGTSDLGAKETANNVPTSFTSLQVKTTGVGGSPISITMKNTGTVPWISNFTAKDTGTPQGTCNYDYSGNGVDDAPASGSASGTQCVVTADLTSQNYFLVNTPSAFSMSPENIPVQYNGVTKTTTYIPGHSVTVQLPCVEIDPAPNALQKDPGNLLSLMKSFIETAFAAISSIPPGTPGGSGICSRTLPVPNAWVVSYSGAGYTSQINSGSSFSFPISSITAPEATGTYNETWQIKGDGSPLGSPFTLPMTVTSTSSLIPPTVTLSAAPTSITLGSSTNLTITTANAASCKGSGSNDGNWNGVEPIDGIVSETPNAVGLAVFTITCTGPGGSGNAGASATATASTSVAVTFFNRGIINIKSENEAYTSVGVNAKWDIVDTGPGLGNTTTLPFPHYNGDVCAEAGALCQGTSSSYWNQPALNTANASSSFGNVSLPQGSVVALDNIGGSPLYALNSIKMVPAVQKNIGVVDEMLALTKNLLGSTAEAWTSPTSTPLDQTLVSHGTVNFLLLWSPLSDIAVSPTTLPLNSVAGATASGQVAITNTGAPGSELTWNSSISYAKGSGWLSIAPTADSSGLINGLSGNNSENVTINVNSAGLAVGSYTGTVTFNDTDLSITGKEPSATLTVTYTVTNSQTPGYICTDNACGIDPSGGGVSSSSCEAACDNGGGGGGSGYSCVNNACKAVTSGGVSQPDCKAACNGGGGGGGSTEYSCINNACAVVTSGGVSYSSCQAACSGGGQEYSCVNNACTVVTSGGVSKPDCEAACSGSTLPTCTGSGCQISCNPPLTATPSSIVIPESSNLNYSCSNATQCQITGGGIDSIEPASDTIPVSPTTTTIYTLTCVNSNYNGDATSSNAKVTVGGSSLCEQNPNAAGCPGQ